MTLISFQISSIIIIVFAAFVIILFEREYPYNTDQKIIRSGFWTDLLFYNILQSFFLGILISFLIEFIDNSANLSRLQLITDWPWFIQIIFFTITHDFYIYWFHRFQHKNKFLWRLHEAHHSPKEVDWLSGVRSHGLEIFINQTIEFLPIVLLGAPPEIAVLKGLVSAVWGMYIHSNLDIKSGKFQYVLNGPEMHRWHHSTGKGRNKNFATKLAIWDWLFGTSYLPPEHAMEYGLRSYFPENYFSQFLFAFRPFKSRSKR